MKADETDELARVGALLAGESDFASLASMLAEQALDATRSDLAAVYLAAGPDAAGRPLRLFHSRGRFAAPERLAASDPLVELACRCGETVVLLERRPVPFAGVLLDGAMRSGVAVALGAPAAGASAAAGLLIVNSLRPLHYDRRRLAFLESCGTLASGLLRNAETLAGLREALERAREQERLQAGILASLSSLELATDESGRLLHYNRGAAERLGLAEADVGRPLAEVLGRSVDAGLLRALERASSAGAPAEARGIWRLGRGDFDFTLRASPLAGRPGAMTILIMEDNREGGEIVEERRLVKDIFAAGAAPEVVSHLAESPRIARLEGDRKEATVALADIHGWAGLCRDAEPAALMEAVKEYLAAVSAVVKEHRGFVDRLLGSAVVAAWGVPLQSVADDARAAAAAALEIREMTRSRRFGAAAMSLEVGIALHTGPVVAGGVGGPGRPGYAVIGDAVTTAARLQPAAGPGEVIVTEETRLHLGGAFVLEPRRAVRVKGASEPMAVYRIVGPSG